MTMSRQLLRAIPWSIGLAVLAFGAQPIARGAQKDTGPAEKKPAAATADHPPLVVLTSADDRKRVMDQLKITSFPATPMAYQAATYDEAKANPYPNLPDPLVFNNGKKVTSASQWTARRAEIVELFDREVYGRRPKVTPKVTWTVASTTNDTVAGIPVITKKLVGNVDNSSYPLLTVNIIASLTVPANAKGPVPVVFGGGGDTSVPEGVTPTTVAPLCAPAGRVGGPGPRAGGPGARAGGPAPAAPTDPPANEQILKRGWGYAALNSGSVQADNGCGLTQGIIGLVNKGQPRKLDDWGVLSAWGWGMSRVLDYLETDKAVDAKRVATMGHSRGGKAALVGLAYDQRFSTGFISSSGESGAKLHRRNYGEVIENIAAANEYHWMAGNFMKYGGRWDTLPVDSHELIAMVAPRPVFLSAGNDPLKNADGSIKLMDPNDPGCLAARGPCATQAAEIYDAWVDAKGTFLAGVGAGPVYKLLGKKDLGTTEYPTRETALMTGDIGFRQHSSGHTPNPNWVYFLDFAAKYWDAKPAAK
jgi:(4-O-methyl)-D-glucuronate---lignin esterase